MRLTPLLLAALASTFLCAPARAADAPAKKTKIVFVAGKPSHGTGEHEHFAGCTLLAKELEASGLNIETVVIKNGWPKDESVFDGASAVVMYCDGGGGHMVVPHLKQMQALSDKGVGIGCIHYAVEVEKDKGGKEFLDWIGGYFETFWSINPVWTATFSKLPEHAVTRGVKPFTTHDEWYYHMRFRDNMEGVTAILSAVPPDKTRQGKDEAHGGNPAVRDGVGKNIAETVVWVSENKNGSRGFGCTGAHYLKNFGQDDFRKTILNCIAWIAKVEVPAEGVASKRPTAEEILANEDDKPNRNVDKAKLQQEIDAMNAPAK